MGPFVAMILTLHKAAAHEDFFKYHSVSARKVSPNNNCMKTREHVKPTLPTVLYDVDQEYFIPNESIIELKDMQANKMDYYSSPKMQQFRTKKIISTKLRNVYGRLKFGSRIVTEEQVLIVSHSKLTPMH